MTRAIVVFVIAAILLLPAQTLQSAISPAVEVQQSGDNLFITNGKVTVAYDLERGLWKVFRGKPGDGGDMLANNCRIKLGEQTANAALYERGYSTQKLADKHGAGLLVKIHYISTDPDYPDLVLTFRFYENRSSFLCELRLTAPQEFGWPISVISFEGTLNLFSAIPECRILSNSLERSSHSEIAWFDFAPDRSSVEIESSYSTVVHERNTKASAIIGATTARCEAGVRIKAEEGSPILRFSVQVRHEPAMVVWAGVSSDTDVFYFGFPENVFDGMEEYASHVRTDSRAKIWESPPCGWSSSDCFGTEVSEKDVIQAANFVASELKPYGMKYILIGNGWQKDGAFSGEWQPGERFPHGAGWLADQLHKQGLKAGLWITPFGEKSASSPRPFRDGQNYDLAHPVFNRWLRSLCSTISSDWGYDHVEADLLHYGKVVRRTPFDIAYRYAARVMSTTLGNNCYLSLSGNDQWLTVGVPAGQRITDQVSGTWAGLLRTVRSACRHYFTQGNFWLADAGHLHVGPSLSMNQARVWATVFALYGGPIIAGDKLWELPQERLELVRKVVPSRARAARPLDLFEPAEGYAPRLPRVWDLPVRGHLGTYHVVALFNWDSETPQEVRLNLADVGFSERDLAIVYDFWNDRFLGVFANYLSLVVDPETTVVLAIHRFSGKPCVLSTDRHILQGAPDIADVSWNDESSTLRGIAASPKGRKYTLSVYCPPGYQAERAMVDNQPTDLSKQGDELLRLCFTPAGDRTSWQISFRTTEKARTREPDVSRISTLPERKADRRPIPLVELLPTGHEECHDSEGWLSVENDDMRILAPCIISYDLRGEFKRLKGAVRSRARRVDTFVSFEVLLDGQKAADGKMPAGEAVQIDVDVTGKRGLKLIGHALTGSDSDAWMTWEHLKLE